MRSHGLGKSVAVAALVAGLAGGSSFVAFAQDKVAVSTSGEIGVKAEATLSSEAQIEQADKTARGANQLAEQLTRMLDEARREKDILRANCVNRKLTEVNATVRNVDQRARALKDAATAGDEGRRNHEYTVVTVLGQKLSSLKQEAAQCLGESVFEPGASQVITTIPNNVFTTTNPAEGAPTPPPPSPAFNVPPDMSEMT